MRVIKQGNGPSITLAPVLPDREENDESALPTRLRGVFAVRMEVFPGRAEVPCCAARARPGVIQVSIEGTSARHVVMVCPLPGVSVSGTSPCRGRSSCQKRSALATSCLSPVPAPSQNRGMTAAAGSLPISSSGVFSSRHLLLPPNGLTVRVGSASWLSYGVK